MIKPLRETAILQKFVYLWTKKSKEVSSRLKIQTKVLKCSSLSAEIGVSKVFAQVVLVFSLKSGKNMDSIQALRSKVRQNIRPPKSLGARAGGRIYLFIE